MLFSAFSPFGLVDFSSDDSEGEKIYRAMVAGYTDPRDGSTSIDLAIDEDNHHEAQVYATSMAIAAARVTLKRAHAQLRGETSYELLTAHESRYSLRPAAEDSLAARQAAVGAKQKLSRGPRLEAVTNALAAILGDNFIAYRPMATDDVESFPADPRRGAGSFKRADVIGKSVRFLTSVARVSLPLTTVGVHVPSGSATATIDPQFQAVAQSFTGNGGHLAAVRWRIATDGAPAGTAYARLFEHGGTFSEDGKPIGQPLLAVMTADVSTFDAVITEREFSAPSERVMLELGKRYFLTLEYEPANFVDVLKVHMGAGHDGNGAYRNMPGGAWNPQPGVDYGFRVLSGPTSEVAYENWNTESAVVTLVRGDVLCVEAGNLGLAERVTVLDSSGSDAERTFTAEFSRPHSAGARATTGPVPLWPSTKRHVLIVVKSAAAIDPASVRRVDELLSAIMRAPTTWALVEPTTPGALTTGPFKIGASSGSPLGTVPLEEITI